MRNTHLRVGPIHNPPRRENELLHLEPFKSPLGYLRIFELIICIVCISTVSCWYMELDYSCRNGSTSVYLHQNRITTFHLSQVEFKGCDEVNRTLWHQNDDARLNVRWFYIVSSLGLIASVVISVTYLFFWRLYCEHDICSLVDLAVSVLLTIIYLICSCVWWAGVSIIGTATSEETIRQLFTENAGFWDLDDMNMSFEREVNQWVLVISVMLNWCSFGLNAASSTYIFKHLKGHIYPT